MPHRGQIQHDSRVTCQVVALCEFSAAPRQHDARLPIDTARRRLLGDGASVVADPPQPPQVTTRGRAVPNRAAFFWAITHSRQQINVSGAYTVLTCKRGYRNALSPLGL